MSKRESIAKPNRRHFLQATAAAIAGATLPWPVAAQEKRGDMPYRPLGSTGEMVSLLGVGGYHIAVRELSDDDGIRMVRTAMDQGVNFLDNAWQYHDGRSEVVMGKALKDGYRDKAFVMTKVLSREPDRVREQLETSLKRLDMDYIDLWQFHSVLEPDDPKKIYEDGLLDIALKAKEEGKIRYIGFTGHYNPAVHQEMLDRGFEFDTVQMPLNVLDHHARSFEQNVLPKVNERRMGALAMKTLGGAGQLPRVIDGITHDDCLRYVMNLTIATLISGMKSMDDLQANLAIAKSYKPFEEDELAQLLAKTRESAGRPEYEPYKIR